MKVKILGIMTVMALAACSDVYERRFASMTEIRAQGMVARGWIPSGLPPSGTDVTVRWDVDTNMVRGCMTVPKDQLPLKGTSLLAPDAHQRLPFNGRASVTPSWWPRELNPPGPASALRAARWDLFVVQGDSPSYVALRHADSRLYFWSEGS
jgi:hypothetical protein